MLKPEKDGWKPRENMCDRSERRPHFHAGAGVRSTASISARRRLSMRQAAMREAIVIVSPTRQFESHVGSERQATNN
ncbi:MAG TPA: hypothetical protein PKA55_13095 [Rhodoblastus sp.]|nr:hypothetical protein [Rhodoblastus sp.]